MSHKWYPNLSAAVLVRRLRPQNGLPAPLAGNPACTKKPLPRLRLQGISVRCFVGYNRLKLKVHSLTGRITPLLMYQAFKNVKRNRGAAGIDKVSIQMFEANLQENLNALMRELKTRDAFQPKPLRRVLIPKGKGKMRPLGIPAGQPNEGISRLT